MSWIPAETVLATIAQKKQALAEENTRLARFADYHAAERVKLDAERVAAAHDLAQGVLPSLDPRAIAAAAETVGMVGLPGEDIPAKVRERRASLAQRLAEIEHDLRYTNRELLRHPTTGSLTRALAEANDMRQPASDTIVTCEGHPRFERLWETGFGSDGFEAPWWRVSYWQDRSAASEVVALFPGKKTFGEVRAEYQSAKETLAIFDADIARLRGELAAVDGLAQEHATLADEQAHLDERALEHTRVRIVQHLLTTDASLMSARLTAYPAIRLLFLRASGTAAKIAYLDAMERAQSQEIRNELATEAAKIDAVEARTRKRWAPMPADKYAKLAVDRRPRYDKRWARIGKVYQTVHVYDHWDRGRYYDDLLWWDIMTRGRYDGSYIPEVSHFHASHPGYAFEPDYKALALAGDADDADDAGIIGSNDGDAAAAGILADDGANDAPDIGSVDAS